nr:DUF6056 family protein [Helicobacter marmotae]
MYFFCVLGVFLLLLNCLLPTQSDDLGASAEGLKGAWRSYMHWNGRIFEMLRVAYVASIAPSIYFALLNTLIALAFILGFFVFIFGRLPRGFDDMMILSILMLIIMFRSAFGAIFLWAAGSLNYLWAYCALIYCFIPYRLYWGRVFDKSSHSQSLVASCSIGLALLQAIGLFVLCFIGGMSSEMIGIVALLVHIGFLIYALRAHLRLPLWYYSGIVGLLLGWLALYFSPGHMERAAVWWELMGRESFYLLSDIWHMSLLAQIKHLNIVYQKFVPLSAFMIVIPILFVCYERIKAGMKPIYLFPCIIALVLWFVFVRHCGKIHSYLVYVVPLLHFVLAIGFFAFMMRFYHRQKREDLAKLFAKLLIAFLLFCLFVGSTIQVGIPSRARLVYVLIGAVMVIFVYRQWCVMLGGQKARRVQNIILALCIAYGIFVLSSYIHGRIKWNAMLDSIEEQKLAGKQEVIVKASTFKSFYHQYGDWGNPGANPNEWPNTSYAHYFGVKSFIVQ